MKVALIQCNTVTGDIMGNAQRILNAVRKVSDASLCVTPELSLCGAHPQDLLYSEDFLAHCREALVYMAERLKGGPAVLVGAPMPHVSSGTALCSNAAVLLQHGKFSIVSTKVAGARTQDEEYRYFEHGMSCGLITVAGWRLGIVLCQDSYAEHSFWKMPQTSAHNPLQELLMRNVDGIVHMASSPYVMSMQEQREHMLSHVAARFHVHLFSSNRVGGNDGSVYAGQSLAFDPTGSLLARGRAFEEDILMVDTATGSELSAKPCPCIEEECWRALVLGTRDFVHKSGMDKVLIGLSGGIDSAIVAAIAVEAFGKKQVHGVRMPSPHTSQESLDYAEKLAKNLGITCSTIDIEPLMHAFHTSLEASFATLPTPENDVTFENIQSRIRGTLLMSLANRQGSMVLNTGNKSEAAMGYCTLYGDSVGALGVIGDMTKTLLYSLAAWYNKNFPEKSIPQAIIDRPPTAELRPNQLDSDSLPPYEELDPLLTQLLHTSASQEDEEEGVAHKAKRRDVFSRLCKAEFKRRQCPPALRVTQHALGKDWCLPVVSKIKA